MIKTNHWIFNLEPKEFRAKKDHWEERRRNCRKYLVVAIHRAMLTAGSSQAIAYWSKHLELAEQKLAALSTTPE